MKPEQAAAAQLRARGIEPSDISVVVMTHLHMDHASAISDFTEATYVLGEGEWARVQRRRARPSTATSASRRRTPSTTARSSTTRGSSSSYSTFGRSFDLFGDGSVRLVYTPGHSAGHQSLIVRLKDREAAARRRRDLLPRRRSSTSAAATSSHDEHNWRRSLREIQLYRRENPDALIIPSHDHELWARLDPKYE